MNYQTRLSTTQVLDILDREAGKKQDQSFGIKKLYTVLWELNQRSTDAFIPEEYSSYLVTADRLSLVYGSTVDGVVIEEGLVVNQGGTIYTLTTNDPSLSASWVILSNNGVVTFPDLLIEGQSSINYNNIFNPPVGAEGINVIQVQARSTANIAGVYDNGVAGVGATFTTSGSLTTLDDYTLIVNDEVALINQTNAAHNGIYTVTSIAGTTLLTRPTVADETIDLYPSEITVANGTLYANRKYRQVTVNPVIGTSNIEYAAITIDDVAAPSYVSGATIYVDRLSNFATDTRTGLSRFNRDRPFSTIQAAINAASSGEVIYIMSGTYTENVTTAKNIHLVLSANTTITASTGNTLQINPQGASNTTVRITGLDKRTSIITNSGTGATIFSNANASYSSIQIFKNVTLSNTSTGTVTLNNAGFNVQDTLTLDDCITSGALRSNSITYNITNTVMSHSTAACISITNLNAISITYNISNSSITSTTGTAISAGYTQSINQTMNITDSRISGQGAITLGTSSGAGVFLTLNVRNSVLSSTNATIPVTFTYFAGATQGGNIQNCIITGSNAASITGAAAGGTLYAIKTVAQGTLGGASVTKVDCFETQAGLTSF